MGFPGFEKPFPIEMQQKGPQVHSKSVADEVFLRLLPILLLLSQTVQVHGIQPVRLVDLGTTGQVSPRQAPVLCGGQDKKRIPIDHIHGLPLCLIEPGPVGQHRCFLVWPLCNAAQRWSTRTRPVRSHSQLVGPGSLGQLQAGIEEPLDVVVRRSLHDGAEDPFAFP